MASFVEAVQASLVGSLDPTTAMTRDFMRKQIEEKDNDVIDRKAETIEKIEQKLAAAEARGAKPSVIGAYEKLLARATA